MLELFERIANLISADQVTLMASVGVFVYMLACLALYAFLPTMVSTEEIE